MRALLDYRILSNDLSAWLLAALAFLCSWIALPLLKHRVSTLARYGKPRRGGVELLSQMLAGTTAMFLSVIALWAATQFLTLNVTVHRVCGLLILTVIWFQVGRWTLIALEHGLQRQRLRRGAADSAFTSSLTVVRFIGSALIWALVLMLALDNFGVDVSALITGLGIGGVAVALAVQTVLKDLIASLTIALDRPFVLGDSITVGKVSGKVESIGVKSTRLRSGDGEQIVVSNADLMQARIRNFGRMDERRAVMSWVVMPGTRAAAIRKVGPIIERIIRAQPGMRFERCHFTGFGPRGMTFEAVFFAIDAQMDAILDAQHHINLAVQMALSRERIALALPVQRMRWQAA